MKKWIVAGTLLASSLALAEQPVSQQEAEWNAAIDAVQNSMVFGASEIPLLDQGVLHLREGFIFVPQPAADMYMHAMGNSKLPSRIGLVMPANNEDDWFIDVTYADSGYVADDDARDWDVDELMDSILAGTEAGNEERVRRGFPPLDISGWVERPDYDAARHQLVWSIGLRDAGADPNEPDTINYNTYLLGREGYFEMTLITTSDRVAVDKLAARTVLDDVEYSFGKRYADFNPDTDHTAEYGLAALVTGVAGKKLGLFAVIAAFFAKFWKLMALGALALFGPLKNALRKKPRE